MRTRLPHLALLTLAVLLSACDPPDEKANDPFAQHNKKLQQLGLEATDFKPPPEIAATLGLKGTDSRQEFLFLQSHASLEFQGYQKNILAVMVGRQSGQRYNALDAAGNASTQQQQLREAVQRKAATIIIDPVEAADLDTDITAAVQAGILVIGLDKSLSGCTTLVYTPPEAIGRAAGELAVEALKRKAAEDGKSEVTGRVVELRGAEKSAWCDSVATSFADALKTQSGIILVHDAPADWNADSALLRLHEAQRIQQQFDIVFAHSDAVARGASRLANTNRFRENILIIGVNAIPGPNEGMQLLRLGDIDATIGRPPLVDAALSIVVKIRSDSAFKPLPEYQIPPLAITPKNHAEASQNGFYTLPKL